MIILIINFGIFVLNLFQLKKIILFFLIFNCLSVKSQIITSDTVLNINCYHSGAIYTNISSLDTNVFSKWHYSTDMFSWILLDTLSADIHLNNSNFNSDSIITLKCGYYKLEIVNVIDTILEVRIYDIECQLSVNSELEIIECYNDFGSIDVSLTSGGVSPYSFVWFHNSVIMPDTVNFLDSLSSGLYHVIVADSLGCIDTIINFLENPERKVTLERLLKHP